MKPQDLKAWRARLGWTQKEAAGHLEVSLMAYKFWEQGRRPIAHTVELATRWLEEHPPGD